MENTQKYYGYKAADFAEICGTTKRTLLYYDEIGLLKPACTAENGTRYYSAEQSMMFLIIQSLKNIGMGLKEIQCYLDTRTQESLHQVLRRQKESIRQQKEDLFQLEKVVDTRLQLLQQKPSCQSDEIIFKECSEEYFILSEQIDSDNENLEHAILFRHLKNIRLCRYESGHPFAALIHCDSLLRGQFDVYSYYGTKIDFPANDPNLHIKAAGCYAVAYLYGDYRQHKETYQRMLDEIHRRGYCCNGYSYKEGIVDEVAERNPKQYVTQISIPVFPAASD